MKHDKLFIHSMLICMLVGAFTMALIEPRMEFAAVLLITAVLFFMNLKQDREEIQQDKIDQCNSRIANAQAVIQAEIEALKQEQSDTQRVADEMRKHLSATRLVESVGKHRMR